MSHQSHYPFSIDLLLKLSEDAVLVFSPLTKKVIRFNHKLVDLFNGETIDHILLERLFFSNPAGRDVITARSGSIIRLRNFKIGKDNRHLEVRLKNIEDKDLGNLTIAIIKDLTQQFKWQKTQEALLKIAESVATSKDLSDLLVQFHNIIRQIMPANNFYVALYHPDQNQISFPYYVDEFDSPPLPQPLGRGLTDYVIRRKTPLLVTPEIFETLLKTGEVEAIGAPSIDWLGVPLLARQVIIGAMAVQSYQHEIRYTQEDLQFLTIVAPHLANAILIKQAEIEQKQQHDLIKSIFDNSPNAIVLTDLKGNFIDCNPAFTTLLNVQSKDRIIGKNALEFIIPEDHQKAIRYFNQVIASHTPLEDEFTGLTLDGQRLILKITASPIKNENQQPQYIVGIFNDITQQRTSETALKISEERYKLASEGANDGIWDWDLLANRIYYSPRWKKLLGYSPDEMSDSPEEWFNRIHEDDLPGVKSNLEAHLSGLIPHFETEHRIRHRDGEYRWVLARGMAVKSEFGNPHRIAGSLTDITRQKANEDQLIHQALYDRLTGLPNRILFIERLDQAIKRSKRHEEPTFAILLLDLDRFKLVNDSLGHRVGDQMIVEVSRRLDECLRAEDTIARLGGDEFAILLNDLHDPYEIIQIINRIQREISRPLVVEGNKVFTTCSIGVAIANPDTDSTEAMMRDADTAMYEAKAQGGNGYMIFDKVMHAKAVTLLDMETHLRQALSRGELVVYYQPIFDAFTQRVVYVEALLRWNHPKHGIVLPNQFIDLAEDTGLILPIGEWVLRESCTQLKKWQASGMKNLKVSVNFSARQFQQTDLPSMVRDALVQTQLDPASLVIEITESRNFSQFEKFETMLWELRGLGVKISIDDFGTGYSSLSTIQRLPVNTIKIGQNFISQIGVQKENDLIIQSMIEMAHRLGLSVIAEGVETEEQLTALRRFHCDMIQGFHFSKPVKANEIENYLKPADY
ncbi:protein containing PAS domain S-box [Bellilinea caldifistulae]|uniref:EAL domain-containing protein n=1 Tax=Bellilinea caldifistulae TaxID=360411 RepID=UPI0007850B09|nr:EAL domain-containing protein [Bellilinea caldifistulae]GAP10739.1 protein containing PAS domain S-box [Bellilinea caldifistulae]